ncbi:MAG: hypothetical protein KC621_32790 [Myxococcales bacterium]|nr:hypothetical protein [Myxococcales bacterium]
MAPSPPSPAIRLHLLGAIAAASAMGCVLVLSLSTAWWPRPDLVMGSMVAGIVAFPCIVWTGTSGHIGAAGRRPPRVRAKRDRMPWIGGPTLFVLLPSGIVAWLLLPGDHVWVVPWIGVVRGIVALAVLTMMARSTRDGLALTMPKRRALQQRSSG